MREVSSGLQRFNGARVPMSIWRSRRPRALNTEQGSQSADRVECIRRFQSFDRYLDRIGRIFLRVYAIRRAMSMNLEWNTRRLSEGMNYLPRLQQRQVWNDEFGCRRFNIS